MSTNTTRLDLFLKEIQDPKAQENWLRLKLYLEQLSVGNTTIINQGGDGGSGSGTSVWEKDSATISSGITAVVDTIPLASFRQLHYEINYLNTVTNRRKGLKMTVINDDSTIEEQVYAISGAPLSLGIFANIVGSNLQISVQNSEASAVEMSFAKLNIP